jgi:hypothetical protein
VLAMDKAEVDMIDLLRKLKKLPKKQKARLYKS